ncbi:DUF305 domain-containing protein [Microbacterium sp.]|uniref:DUF305 domain-containing protein n=1 Tax=Microbacterium sp. TaxID=51671 RepID=UPI002D766685|nr:DUF305 domain-containing protein [Microbacterium sp.]HET6300722.1 DUF305 domain-containing protein [Microbacterium sp.]
MTTPRRLAPLGAAAALAFVLTACTADPQPPTPVSTVPVIQPGAPGEPNRTLSPEEAADALSSPPYTEEDVRFVRDMLHHHAQALVMTGYVDDRTTNRDIRLLAERMEISQTDEIAQLEKWLRDRAEPIRDPDAAHDAHADMPGLLTDEEIARLEAATGTEFERLFLEFMIKHHEGAIQMVIDLDGAGGGQETEIGLFARHVEADQGIEIARMQQLLAQYD